MKVSPAIDWLFAVLGTESVDNTPSVFKRPDSTRSRPSTLDQKPEPGFGTYALLPLSIWQKLPRHRDSDAISFTVFFFFDIQSEIYGAHYSITKLFVNHCLQRHSIHLHDFIKPIDQ